MSIDEYWDLTPNEFRVHIEIHKEKLKDDNYKITSQAWHTAMFERQEKLESLSNYINVEEIDNKEEIDEIDDLKRIAEKNGIKHNWG